MKTRFLTIFTTLIIVLGIAGSTFAATAGKENITILNHISRISKIEVHGNVELYLSDGAADEVKVYNKYYSESALVQCQNGVLRISSYQAEKLVVWVTAADLRAISLYDNAAVKSFGSFSQIALDVELHNTASANLDLDVVSANVAVYDNGKANLKGTVQDFDLTFSRSASVNQTGFVARNISTTLTTGKKDNGEDIAGL
ncbi:hypothetical protein BH09BAC6_BH09BAC6_06230 [soil metagenome]|jgi:hypothetical protein